MKLEKLAGATSEIWQVFVRDSSSTTGGGLTGLTNASASLTAYYHRDTDTTATAISLVSMTAGTFTSSGFKEIDATNMPGWYQFCPPNAAIASGAKSCAFHLKGVTNMAPLPIEVQLTAVDPDNATSLGLSRLDAAITSRMATYTQPTGFLAASFPSAVGDATAANQSTINTNILAVPAAVWATTMTGTTTAIQAMRGFIAAMLGKASGLDTNAPKYRNIADNKDVISATTDANGNRTAVTLDLS